MVTSRKAAPDHDPLLQRFDHLDSVWRRALQRRLAKWFRQAARDLPWRRTRDPYAIWVSEIMLQQTQVVTVIPYYERFLATFPDVNALAAATEHHVLRLWEGLGYYRRARQLHRAARQIVERHNGMFPQTLAEVEALPGIGRYTAGAILSIAFDDPQPILEANTARLYSRLLAYHGDLATNAGKQPLWDFAEWIVPPRESGHFNQALMELGATICTPRQPRCDVCPAADLCPTRLQGLQAEIPRVIRKSYEEVWEACLVVWRRDRVLLRQCGAGERWAGLWDFPRFPVATTDRASLDEVAVHLKRLVGVGITNLDHFTTLKHGVTRFRITLDCYRAQYRDGRVRGAQVKWLKTDDLVDYPLSRTARRIAQLLATDGPGSPSYLG